MRPFLKALARLVFIIVLFSSCQSKKKETLLFELMEKSGIDFTNSIHNTKDFNIFSYRNFYNGGGVGIGDINNDGLADVFFTANMGSNKLYLNKGNFQFEDITTKAEFVNSGKWGTGVVMVDINSDGWLDIYVCNAGYIKGVGQENELYINNRDLTFTEAAKEYGLAEGGYTTHAAFFDYDLDGDLDCYILNNSFIPVNTLNYANKRDLRADDWPVADFLKGGGDKLLRNDKGKFTNVSQEAGIYSSLIGFGLGITVGDVNSDHYPDIYVSNDFFEKDYLYLNQKNGTFKEDIEHCMQHISHSSMGADIADINNDGYPDVFTTDMLPDNDYRLKTTTSFETFEVNRYKVASGFYNQFMQNTLQVNNKNGKFLEAGFYSGVAASDWSWGGLIFDADNDGLSDLFVCNGIYHDVTDQDFIEFFANDIIQRMVMTGQRDEVDSVINKMPSHPIPNKAFKNLGNLKFADNADTWGLAQPSFSNGAAYGDLDNDGDLDMVVNNVNQKAFVYRNNSRQLLKNGFIEISLKGKGSNTFAIGSFVKIFTGKEVISREVIPSRGFQSSVDYKIVVGLGEMKKVDSMVVIWPDRSYTKIDKPAINKVHIVKQENTIPLPVADKISTNFLFRKTEQIFQKHVEDDYTDFYEERGIPMMISREGPKAAYGDVNGDGLTDVFIGGAANQPSKLYLQTAMGFVEKKQVAFDRMAVFEDVAASFFDCDRDGDLDLFVGSGGNNHPPHSLEYQNRLYLNDGKGNFEISDNRGNGGGMNTSVVAANDFDKDGDMDVFIGSRSVPKNYGQIPPSFLLLNDGTGRFTDISASNPSIANVGMVTGAIWTNVTGDAKEELVVVGEWMHPRIFANAGGRFEEVKTNLTGQMGWWRSVVSADMDGDGDNDLALGNIGENFYLRPNDKEPVKLWMNDFDENGSAEKIITKTIDGKDKPVFQKKELVDQIASLRKQNLKYSDFANKSIQELFPTSVIDKCVVRQFNYPSSCIAYNEGNGKFTISPLPMYVQLSSVNAISCSDINGDGKMDLVMAGNQFGFLPQFSRVDASFGHVLINKGNRTFEYIGPDKSGLDIPGQVNDIVEISNKNRKQFLFLQNNDYPLLYTLNAKSTETQPGLTAKGRKAK